MSLSIYTNGFLSHQCGLVPQKSVKRCVVYASIYTNSQRSPLTNRLGMSDFHLMLLVLLIPVLPSATGSNASNLAKSSHTVREFPPCQCIDTLKHNQSLKANTSEEHGTNGESSHHVRFLFPPPRPPSLPIPKRGRLGPSVGRRGWSGTRWRVWTSATSASPSPSPSGSSSPASPRSVSLPLPQDRTSRSPGPGGQCSTCPVG